MVQNHEKPTWALIYILFCFIAVTVLSCPVPYRYHGALWYIPTLKIFKPQSFKDSSCAPYTLYVSSKIRIRNLQKQKLTSTKRYQKLKDTRNLKSRPKKNLKIQQKKAHKIKIKQTEIEGNRKEKEKKKHPWMSKAPKKQRWLFR